VTIDMTEGLVPLPPHRRRLVVQRDQEGRWSKPPGVGWSALGRRRIRGVTLHRLDATLWAADRDLRDPAAATLLDWGIDHQTGETLLWNDPTGEATPWASGPIAGPYGDGAAFLARFAALSRVGPEVVDRDRVNLGVGGFYRRPGGRWAIESPWSEASRQAVAQLCAHYAHEYGVAWHEFPIAPEDGFSFLAWHHEFAQGAGAVCPGRLVMDLTDDLVERARQILRAHQTGTEPPQTATGIVYPEGLNRARAVELFGELPTAGGPIRFDERDHVARLWLEVGAVERRRFPPLQEAIEGTVPGERYYRFQGGLLIRRAGRLVEVVATSGRAVGDPNDGDALPSLRLTAGSAVGPPVSIPPLPPWDTKRPETHGLDLLTAREREVLALLPLGLRDGEIGLRFGISTRTVECHVQRVLRKLDLPNRAAAAAFAALHGLTTGDELQQPPAA
jgi:DNA-binding CsgD family transcriptional regulator